MNVKNIVIPNKDIYVVDSKSISETVSTFYFKSKGNFIMKFSYEDANNEKIYKCKYGNLSGNCSFRSPKTDKALYKMEGKFHFKKPNELFIHKIQNDKEVEKNNL